MLFCSNLDVCKRHWTNTDQAIQLKAVSSPYYKAKKARSRSDSASKDKIWKVDRQVYDCWTAKVRKTLCGAGWRGEEGCWAALVYCSSVQSLDWVERDGKKIISQGPFVNYSDRSFSLWLQTRILQVFLGRMVLNSLSALSEIYFTRWFLLAQSDYICLLFSRNSLKFLSSNDNFFWFPFLLYSILFHTYFHHLGGIFGGRTIKLSCLIWHLKVRMY